MNFFLPEFASLSDINVLGVHQVWCHSADPGDIHSLHNHANPFSHCGFIKTVLYLAGKWTRVFTKHGQTLLTLAFNYDVLSLHMLTFGVEEIDVELLEEYPGCFSHLEEDDKIRMLRDLVMRDFKVGRGFN